MVILNKERVDGTATQESLGEMINTVCFYLVGVCCAEGAALRSEAQAIRYIGIWLAGLACLFGGARFLIADLLAK